MLPLFEIDLVSWVSGRPLASCPLARGPLVKSPAMERSQLSVAKSSSLLLLAPDLEAAKLNIETGCAKLAAFASISLFYEAKRLFPRLNRWGLIEASDCIAAPVISIQFPRLNRWGLIEAFPRSPMSRIMVFVFSFPA